MSNVQNVYNRKRKVYVFSRKEDGTLETKTEEKFYPYYYELSKDGTLPTYDNKRVKKVVVAEPGDVAKQRSSNSYEADVLFPKRYIVDNITQFTKGLVRYVLFDIEILAKDMPDPKQAKDPISCITVYDSFTKEYTTWYMGDVGEEGVINGFIEYIKTIQPDVLFAWNVDFDYTYLACRIDRFAQKISPINECRIGDVDDIFYPAGISVVDYMGLFKKVKMREQSYALDKISQKYLKETAWGDTTFGELNEHVKEKNINDVKRMVKIEEKFKIIEYYNQIRCSAMCLWEDLMFNSKVLDMMILREARVKGIVLPNKQKTDEDAEELEGAYRRADVGVYRNIYKADVGSMYPSQMINFCLDAQNIRQIKEDNTININGIFIKQNKEAIIPHLASKLILQKDVIKKQLKGMSPSDKEYENTKSKYDAIKALVNSLYGVTALSSFRLYNFSIASSITFLSRELLLYVEEKMKERGHNVVYTDTDALMYGADKDEIDFLNELVCDWSIENYSKYDIKILFDTEGMFEKLLILGKCHYFGYLEGKVDPEIKGMEMKRNSSSKFEASFQRAFVDRVLNGEPKEKVVEWIKSECKRIRTLPLTEVSFPCKIANKTYVNEPIFVRAYNNTRQIIKSFTLNKGETFYYVYVDSLGYDAKGKHINVIAFTDSIKPVNFRVDWDEVIRRNIVMKADALFEAIGWGEFGRLMTTQCSLF